MREYNGSLRSVSEATRSSPLSLRPTRERRGSLNILPANVPKTGMGHPNHRSPGPFRRSAIRNLSPSEPVTRPCPHFSPLESLPAIDTVTNAERWGEPRHSLPQYVARVLEPVKARPEENRRATYPKRAVVPFESDDTPVGKVEVSRVFSAVAPDDNPRIATTLHKHAEPEEPPPPEINEIDDIDAGPQEPPSPDEPPQPWPQQHRSSESSRLSFRARASTRAISSTSESSVGGCSQDS